MTDEYTPTTDEALRSLPGARCSRAAPGYVFIDVAVFDAWLTEHDRVVATRALREAAREVHIEARWAAECRVARRPYTPTERLAMLEQILTDRIAAGEDEADSFANTNASGNNPTPLSQTEPPMEVVE